MVVTLLVDPADDSLRRDAAALSRLELRLVEALGEPVHAAQFVGGVPCAEPVRSARAVFAACPDGCCAWCAAHGSGTGVNPPGAANAVGAGGGNCCENHGFIGN